MASEEKTAEGPLAGVRVVDLSRLAPGPYLTMLLADLGAEVIAVGGGRTSVPIPEFSRGKRFISLNLKQEAGRKALQALAKTADVFVEGFRPGVAARLGAEYATLSALNPRLVYCAVTGYGQSGPRALNAGHDINYVALSGVLSGMGPKESRPYPPLNLVGDFAGGSMLAAIGILSALIHARATGEGQFIDAAMIDGCLSLMAMHLPLWRTAHWPERGSGLLSGAAPFYRTYACADGKFVAVGALEDGFFKELWSKLGLSDPPDHMSISEWPAIEAKLTAAFAEKSRDDWAAVFASSDACVTPVLEPDEIWEEPQIKARHPASGPSCVPAVPFFSRTPAKARPTDLTDQSLAVLGELGMSEADIKAATAASGEPLSGLAWPPEFKP